MSVNAPNIFAQQFASTIQLLLQQKGSKLKGHTMSGSHVGEQAQPVDQIGAIAARKVNTRFGAMGRVDAELTSRWVFPQDYDLPQLFDSFDKLKMLVDPTGAYVQNGLYAMGRACDDEIIAAFFGDAKTGKNAGTTTSFPAANQIAVNFGAAANVGLTVAKLREAKRLLMSYEVDIEADPIAAIVTSQQHDDLLAEVQVISTEFSDKPVMVEGKVTRFLGINIIHCERLGLDGSSFRRVPIFAKSGMYLGIWEDMMSTVSQRDDLQGMPWQSYIKQSLGATRLEENKVIEVKCSEA